MASACNAPAFVARNLESGETTLDASISPPSSSSSGVETPEAFGCTPGMVKPCSETREGLEVHFPEDVALYPCQRGTKTCGADRSWGPCLGLIGPKKQDSCLRADDDSNCNGKKNEGCPCVPGQKRSCGSDEGECRRGTQECIHGRWSQTCLHEIAPRVEICDKLGRDEDCDGKADSSDPDCGCAEGSFELCELEATPGECEEEGIKCGNCGLGVRICLGGVFTDCRPRFGASPESCGRPLSDRWGNATRDEDCDGKKDENDSNGAPPSHCTHYMVDRDKDKWGKIGPSFNSTEPEGATHGCFCTLPRLLEAKGFVVAPGFDRVNKDCADDPDYGGEKVHPGYHSGFYDRPSLALQNRDPAWPHGAYDYDCDGYIFKGNNGSRYLDCVYFSEFKQCNWSSDNSFWRRDETPPDCGTWVEVPACRSDPSKPITERCYVSEENTGATSVECR